MPGKLPQIEYIDVVEYIISFLWLSEGLFLDLDFSPLENLGLVNSLDGLVCT